MQKNVRLLNDYSSKVSTVFTIIRMSKLVKQKEEIMHCQTWLWV